MKLSLHSTLLVSLLVSLLPAAAQVHTYEVVTADVPFKFSVGERTFRPGQYQFILVGPGLLALRDARQRVVASLVTRSVATNQPAIATRLVFNLKKRPAKLARIVFENQSQVLEILGEQLALRSSPTQAPPLPAGSFSFNDRGSGIRLRQ